MRKIVTALAVAATVGAAAIASSGTADAAPWYWRGPGPVFGGFVAGAIIGGMLAPRPYYYPYAYYRPYPYGPRPGCAWRAAWDGYRWVRVCY